MKSQHLCEPKDFMWIRCAANSGLTEHRSSYSSAPDWRARAGYRARMERLTGSALNQILLSLALDSVTQAWRLVSGSHSISHDEMPQPPPSN
jgi:hypothetical protein